MIGDNKKAFTYDDVLLIPRYSEIESRHNVDLSTSPVVVGDKTYKMDIPLIGAPMDTVCGPEMCVSLYDYGAVGVLHRYCSVEQQLKYYQHIKTNAADAVVAIGATNGVASRVEALYELGCRAFCIDVAHGNHIFVKRTIDMLRSEYGDEIHIMAGNVCDYTGAYNCFKWGADSIRVGVGGGSVCTTRIVTGHGMPNLSAVMAAAQARAQYINDCDTEDNPVIRQLYIIADGGIRNSGDAAKALAFGADFVMVGSMLAGTEETPPVLALRNQNILSDNIEVEYRGMASQQAQEANGRVSIVEGVATKVSLQGPVEDVLTTFAGGLKSALSYSNSLNLKEFRTKAQYTAISSSSKAENMPHKLLGG